ncbi:MAG: aspartate aminotransferase family protein [Phycisphaeraceae bacterium]|nr:aspartate aminotransferase family protein [Phycisphaeraceae bacterium]
MATKHELLSDAAQRALRYLDDLDSRAVYPDDHAIRQLAELRKPLPDDPQPPAETLELLDRVGSPATVASTGGRYFGFVIGSSLPVTVAANWLAAAWGQNAGMRASSPISATLEDVALTWLVDLLGLPKGTGGGFVTGATMANFTALAAARRTLLLRAGWDGEEQGLFDAPPLRVVVGEEAHVSVLKAVAMLGLGRGRVLRVPVDGQGRIQPDAMPPLDDRTIVCLQAGNVNTGAFDPATDICPAAKQAGAWVHVDGAFGLWAAASPRHAHLMHGYADADSWATDAHKWLNVPYDSGLVFCRNAEHLRGAMAMSAAYLVTDQQREPSHFTPELSRRSRGVEVWAALRTLGRRGIADMIDRHIRHAQRFAEGLRHAGFDVLNDVALNQVLVSFGDDRTTRQVIAEVQREGTCWCGGTQWRGRAAMRISVSSWSTTEADVERSLDAMLRAARNVCDQSSSQADAYSF